MRFYEEFSPSGQSYNERTGPPRAGEAAIGAVTVNFADLDETIAGAIALLLKREKAVGVIVTAEMSFKNKVHLMSALTRHDVATGAWKPIGLEASEVLPELVAICFKAEELRNGVVHTSWDGAHRRKRTAKAKGLKEQRLPGDSGSILDVSDYISYVVMMVDQFFAPEGTSQVDWLKDSIRDTDSLT